MNVRQLIEALEEVERDHTLGDTFRVVIPTRFVDEWRTVTDLEVAPAGDQLAVRVLP